ncbi:cryptochrome/photolyase family protein [Bdellovibrio sp. HCB337]|uniref:cryptochrome/photolyase family protein n=1 Tax=Bdellovibrio sp. HCB337 TaxID=3394358 RepID=UPI0039A71326
MNFFWFRRDLRIDDNAGLYHALREGGSVLPVFIFDTDILDKLEDKDDRRVQFIYETLTELKSELRRLGTDLLVFHGRPLEVWKKLLATHSPQGVYTNHDYEPYAIKRDAAVEKLCKSLGVGFHSYKDQVIFEKDEIVTEARKPYTVYTPYKKKWQAGLSDFYLQSYPNSRYFKNFAKVKKQETMPSLQKIGFKHTDFDFPPLKLEAKLLKNYDKTRDFPALEKGTSHLGIHLRFGTVSIRELAREAVKFSPVWLSELAWREFFMQILYHFPKVEKQSFRPEYENVSWRNSKADFERWCEGMTGYPLVDAGMRELNETGYMHNRVRMVTASFLTKHLLLHWYDGERYFARKLLDFELASNNGNWQWSAGTGCDAAPYFRIFNPQTQLERFDKKGDYIRKWIPELGTSRYPKPIVDHVFARQRALKAFQSALKPME